MTNLLADLKYILVAILLFLCAFLYYQKSAAENKIHLQNTEIMALRGELIAIAEVANSNASELQKADTEHRKTLSLLNELQTTLSESQFLNREIEREILAADSTRNGDVSDVLQMLRIKKFVGGAK